MILAVRYGSYAFGTEVPESDLDMRGVSGLAQPTPGTAPWVGPKATMAIADVPAFVMHCCAGRNTFIEIPWTDPQDYLFVTQPGLILIARRYLFLSQQIRVALLAHAKDHLDYMIASDEQLRSDDETREHYLKHRNATRRDLILAHGYDTKDAALVMRLLRHVREALTDGRLWIRRPDAKDLRALRNGAWPYEQFMDWAWAEMADLIKTKTDLPERPDMAKVADLIAEVHAAFIATPNVHCWYRRGGSLAEARVLHGPDPAPIIDPAIRAQYSWGQNR